jgi:hypothetical protein
MSAHPLQQFFDQAVVNHPLAARRIGDAMQRLLPDDRTADMVHGVAVHDALVERQHRLVVAHLAALDSALDEARLMRSAASVVGVTVPAEPPGWSGGAWDQVPATATAAPAPGGPSPGDDDGEAAWERGKMRVPVRLTKNEERLLAELAAAAPRGRVDVVWWRSRAPGTAGKVYDKMTAYRGLERKRLALSDPNGSYATTSGLVRASCAPPKKEKP